MRHHTTAGAAIVATVLTAGVLAGCLPHSHDPGVIATPTADTETVAVTRVVDGDTLIVTPTGHAPLRVRLIGVFPVKSVC